MEGVAEWEGALQFKLHEEEVYSTDKYALNKSDLLKVLHQQMLNDAHVNAAVETARACAETHDVLLMNSFFYSIVQSQSTIEALTLKLTRIDKNFPLTNKKILCFPIHLSLHWIVCVIDLQARVICLVDSMLQPGAKMVGGVGQTNWTILQTVENAIRVWESLAGPPVDEPFFYELMPHYQRQPMALCGFYAIMYILVQANCSFIWKSTVSLTTETSCGLYLANLLTGRNSNWHHNLCQLVEPVPLALHRLWYKASFGREEHYHMFFTEFDLDRMAAETWPSYGPVPDYRDWTEGLRTCLCLTEKMKTECAKTGGYATVNIVYSPGETTEAHNYFCELLRLCYAQRGAKKYDLCLRMVLRDSFCCRKLLKIFDFNQGWVTSLLRMKPVYPPDSTIVRALDAVCADLCFYATCAASFAFADWELVFEDEETTLFAGHVVQCGKSEY